MKFDAKTIEEIRKICESIGYSDPEIINGEVFAFLGSEVMKTPVQNGRIFDLLNEAADNQFWRIEKRQSRWIIVLSVLCACQIVFGFTTGTLTWFSSLYQLVPNELQFSLSATLLLLRLLTIIFLLITSLFVINQSLKNSPWKPTAITALIIVNLTLLSDALSYFVLPFLNCSQL